MGSAAGVGSVWHGTLLHCSGCDRLAEAPDQENAGELGISLTVDGASVHACAIRQRRLSVERRRFQKRPEFSIG